MGNQMIMPKINLLKLPDPAAQTAKFVNMMNATRQQEAAELQATRAQQEMAYATAEEGRRKDLHEPAMTKARADNIRAIVADLTEQYKLVDSDAGHQMWLKRLEKADPETAAQVKVAVPTYNPDKIFSIMLKAKEYADKLVPDATSSLEIADEGGVDAQGNRIPKNTPVQVTRGLRPNTQAIRSADAPMGAPRTPTAAPQAASANPFAPGYKPNSAAAPVNSLSLVVDSALETGVMAKSDFDKLVRIAQPGTGPKLEAWARQNNITIAPDAPGVTDNQMRGAAADFEMSPMAANPVQTPQSQFAVYRGDPMQSQTAGLDGAPPMQNTMAQYQPIQRRDPNVSPTPGVYNVPTQDVAATSRATRPSAGEVYDTELAKIKAARAAGPAPATPKEKRARQTEVAKAYSQTQSLIDKTYNPKEGAIALARKIKLLSPDQKEAITGFSGYVPSFRESSREADTLIGNLKGVVTALGKDAAAASGAIGPMAVQEWKIVSDQIANLDLEGMTPRALDAQMDRIIQQVSNATRLAERVYDVQYGDDIKEYPSFKLRGAPPPKAKTPVTKAPPGVSATEWKAMTPAERKLWQ